MLDRIPPESLSEFGNNLEISGVLFANGKEAHMIVFPETTFPLAVHDYQLSHEGWKELLYQLDTLQVNGQDGLVKVVLRKSQRHIEQGVTWNVFRRDSFCCRYCAADNVPLTVDHIILWEAMGDSVEDNLISACRKCNKTRGNMPFTSWIVSDYYKSKIMNFADPNQANKYNIELGLKALNVPLRKSPRSR